MTKREAQDLAEQYRRLERLGITYADADALRRISMTLRRWFELECGSGDGQVSVSIERDGDEPDSPPYRRVQYPTRGGGWQDRRYKIADRETGARRRLAIIMAKYPTLTAYVQGDPRGCSLYILREDDRIAGHSIDSYYTRGVAVA